MTPLADRSYPMPAVGIRSSARAVFLTLVLVALGFWGCAGGVRVIQEGPDSGVALYVYKGKDGHLRSSNRPEASARIRKFCRGPYRVIKEGNTGGRQRVFENIAGAEDVVTDHWWGIRFRCEANGGAMSETG